MNPQTIIPAVDIFSARKSVINWQNQLTAIVDGYKSHAAISHGVQKDGVQNCWDARINKKTGQNWSMTFELVKGKKGQTYLIITDEGTTGLTGRVLVPEELEQDLPSDERWGRFENVAFTKTREEEALGSRGRGKFIFVGASKNCTIFYDTLRQDGSYRFGYRTIILTGSPIDAFDEDEGKKKLKNYTNGDIEPLKTVGTRVIIVNPYDEIIEEINNGNFLRSIEETWWETIMKCDAKIYVANEKGRKRAKIPKEFKLPDEDGPDISVWKKNDIVMESDGEKLKIKHLHFICSMNKVIPEDLRGISIQRGGMKICSIPIRYLPQNMSDSIYGYVSFDKKLDKRMQEAEGIEHYDFNFRKSVPKSVKRLIEDELARFAREKLGQGGNIEDTRRQMQNNAERQAVYAVNRILKQLGLSGMGMGKKKRKKHKRIDQVKKKYALILSDFDFLRETRRVNYGEELKGAILTGYNKAENPITVRIKMHVVHAEQLTGEHLLDEDIKIDASRELDISELAFKITEECFPEPGRYSVRAKMIAIDVPGIKKGTELDKTGKTFYVEEDPPETGLFERCDAMPYPEGEDIEIIMGEAFPGEDQGYIFQYNIEHPAFKAYCDSEKELTDYLVRIMADETPRVILREGDQEIFPEEMVNDPEMFTKEISKLQGKILHSYFKG